MEPRCETCLQPQPACTCTRMVCEPVANDPIRDQLTRALAAAAVRLRDAELEKRAAGRAYAEALEAFNRHAAPVPPAE